MDERLFRDRAAAIYKAVIARLDREDPDVIEAEMSAGVVRIRSHSGSVYVLNIQPPLREVWYAAGDRAWHFAFDVQKQLWIDPRNGDDLTEVLNSTLSKAAGLPLTFALPETQNPPPIFSAAADLGCISKSKERRE